MIIFIYLLKLNDQTWYIGLTTNMDRRLKQHQKGYGSIHTRGKKIVENEVILTQQVKNKWQGRLIENTIANDYRKDHSDRIIRGGELSTRYKKILLKRSLFR